MKATTSTIGKTFSSETSRDCKVKIFLRRVSPHCQVYLILLYQTLHIFPFQQREESFGGRSRVTTITATLMSIAISIPTSLVIFCLVHFFQLFICVPSLLLLLMPKCLPDEPEIGVDLITFNQMVQTRVYFLLSLSMVSVLVHIWCCRGGCKQTNNYNNNMTTKQQKDPTNNKLEMI